MKSDARPRDRKAADVRDDRAPVTELLATWSDGNDAAGHEVIEALYPELRKVAGSLLRRKGNLSIQLTELVSETYLRMEKARGYRWESRGHFLGVGAKLMRQVLVDLARRKVSAKRGAGVPLLVLDESVAGAASHSASDVIAVHQALESLEASDPLAAKLVELRYFGGLTIEETARALEIGRTKAIKVWGYARTRMKWQLTRSPGI